MRSLVMSLALLVLLTGCGSAVPRAASPSATSTPLPNLIWNLVPLPNHTSPMHGAGFALSTSAAHVAWACVPAGDGAYTIWRLSDPNGAWTQTGTFTPSGPLPVTHCDLNVDQTDPHTLVARVGWGCGECGDDGGRSYLSTDDGAHWRAFDTTLTIGDIGEVEGQTFAILTTMLSRTAQPTFSLVVSGDHLRTWKPVHVAPGRTYYLWVSPTGDLLVGVGDVSLWHSADKGLTWTQIPMPGLSTAFKMVRWLTAQQWWHICVQQGEQTDVNACSDDLGQTWANEPRLNRVIGCGQCLKGAQPSVCTPSSMGVDGSLYAACPPDGYDSTSGPAPYSLLYRLAPHTTTWVAIAQTRIVPGVIWDDGVLWSISAEGIFYTTMLAA